MRETDDHKPLRRWHDLPGQRYNLGRIPETTSDKKVPKDRPQRAETIRRSADAFCSTNRRGKICKANHERDLLGVGPVLRRETASSFACCPRRPEVRSSWLPILPINSPIRERVQGAAPSLPRRKDPVLDTLRK
jgi:hypothetical protein